MLSPRLPNTFVDINTALGKVGEVVNVIGVVTDIQSPVPTQGTDWQCTVTIQDAERSILYGRDQVRVKFFRPQQQLPSFKALGDVAVFRFIRVTEYRGMTIAISTKTSGCVLFSKESMPSPPFDLAYHGGKLDLSYEATPPQTKPTSDEQLYAISLYHSYIQLHGPVTSNDAKSVTASSKASGPVEISGPALVHRQNSALTTRARTPRFRLIKDIQNRVFSDLVVQVVKMFLCHDGTVEFYVTDYTENGLLHHYKSPEEWGNQPLDGDPYGYQNLALKKQWVGPFGKHVLQVKLWGSNAAWAKSNVKEEGFVFLRNVTIKTSMDSRLEAALHEDRKYPGRVDLETLQLSDPDVIQVLRRKQEYTTKRKSHNSGTDNPRLSKAARKRKRKSEKKEMVHQKVPVDRNRPPNMPSKAVTSSNSNVKCGYPQVPISPLSVLVDEKLLYQKIPSGNDVRLPFVNIKCRVRVRVIDFFPPQLEDFSHSFVDDTYNLLSSTDDTGIERHEADENQLSHPSPSNWEWAFFLLLEDACQTSAPSVAATRLPVLVSHDDAIYLLKLDAVNLRRDEKTLAELRERLFILWGNLAEVKSDFSTKLTSREFETCIQEYSVRGPNGWQRLHRLFQITITE